MARNKPKSKSKAKPGAFAMFNVAYEDGSMTSNRRVPEELLDSAFGDERLALARTAIQDQDNEIAERSGQRRAKIKSVVEA